MPVFAALVKALFLQGYGLLLALVTQRIGLKIAAIATMAGLYVGAVAAFSAFVSPLIGALFSTAYGQVIGLAFPPVAGTVVAGYVALWVLLVVKNYYMRAVNIGAR